MWNVVIISPQKLDIIAKNLLCEVKATFGNQNLIVCHGAEVKVCGKCEETPSEQVFWSNLSWLFLTFPSIVGTFPTNGSKHW